MASTHWPSKWPRCWACSKSCWPSRAKALTTYERAALDRALYQTYAAVGITADTSTHDRPAPLMRDLQALLAGTAGELAAGLATRLDRYVSGLARGGSVRRTDQRVAESTAGRVQHSAAGGRASASGDSPDRELRLEPCTAPAASAHARIDEAWTLLRYPEGGAFISGLARRARKYYLGLVTIWQKVGDLVGTEHGETVLTNSDMKLLLKQSDEIIEAADDMIPVYPQRAAVSVGCTER